MPCTLASRCTSFRLSNTTSKRSSAPRWREGASKLSARKKSFGVDFVGQDISPNQPSHHCLPVAGKHFQWCLRKRRRFETVGGTQSGDRLSVDRESSQQLACPADEHHHCQDESNQRETDEPPSTGAYSPLEGSRVAPNPSPLPASRQAWQVVRRQRSTSRREGTSMTRYFLSRAPCRSCSQPTSRPPRAERPSSRDS